MRHTVKEEINGVLAFVGAIWGVFLLDALTPLDLTPYGVLPRTWRGLIGIPVMPFLHAGWGHLLNNTLPLLVLLMLLAGSRASSWLVVMSIALLGGIMLWLVGRPAVHVGASGLIFGLIAYLIVAGVLERRFVPLAISAVVTVLFGGTLLWGIAPQLGGHVSWEGHLSGACAGAVVAFALARRGTDARAGAV